MSDWQLLYKQSFRPGIESELPLFLSDERLIIRVSLLEPDNRRNPGSLLQLPFVDGLGQIQGDIVYLSDGIRIYTFYNDYKYRLLLSTKSAIELTIWSLSVPISKVSVAYPISSSAASSTVAAPNPIASFLILAANVNRKGATIWNATGGKLYIDFDGAATASDYSLCLDPNEYLEIPFGFTGIISGILSVAAGNILVREFV